MPLSEFLRMARGKLESGQQKTSTCPADLSSVCGDDLVELVWENGQVMMQGQSNRAKKSPNPNYCPTQTPGVRDKYSGNASIPKVGRFGALESILDDSPASVPSGEIGLSQDDEIVPWLNYSIDDSFKQDYFSELLPEISGVTGNVPLTHNCFASLDKRSCSQMIGHSHSVAAHNGVNIEPGDISKVSSSSAGLLSPYTPHPGQMSVSSLGSGVSSIAKNSRSHNLDMFFGSSVQGQASGGFMSMKLQKHNLGPSDSGSSLLNFSHFSRPAALFRANHQKTDSLAATCSSAVETMGNEEKVPAASGSIPIKSTHIEPSNNSRKEIGLQSQPKLVFPQVDSRPSVVKPLEDSCPAAESDALCQEDTIKNDKSPGQGSGASKTKEVTDAERTVEPVVTASSVCSGNSAERASNDHIHNAKRKHCDNDESESRSEDIEEESVGIRKPASAQRGSGSKRSRAAEVHNLSERRRRDRINEKMRALQELIPNCNKADKASMLDEAIEYLKTLQLQVQIMSMGAGLCMPPMMFPTGLQHMHAAHMPHFSPVGSGMSVGMGFGMGMLDMNSGSPRFPIFPMPPMQGAPFPSPAISGSSTFQGVAGSNLQVFRHPNQGLPMSIPRAPLVPFLGQVPISSTMGLNTSLGIHMQAPQISSVINPDVPVQNKNLQLMHTARTSSPMNQTSTQPQATNHLFDQSASAPKDDTAADASGTATANLTSTNDDVSSKEGSDYVRKQNAK